MSIDVLREARRMSFRMWDDPEAEWCAHCATVQYTANFDPTKGVSELGYLSYLVRMNVWDAWRKVKRWRREKQRSDLFWERVADVRVSYEPKLKDWELLMLQRIYIDRMPMESVGRLLGVGVKTVKQWRDEAIAKLQEGP